MIIKLDRRDNTFSNVDIIITHTGDSYEVGEYIDRGGNAAVHECTDIEGGVFAVKFLLRINKKMLTRFEQEIQALKVTKHPHLISYVGDGEVSLVNENGKTENVRFLIMERADSNLLAYLKNTSKIGYEVYAPQFRGLSEALAMLHNIAIHRDLKPENILIKGERWLISDLGLCSFSGEEHHLDLTGGDEKVGPKYWLSPEALNCIYLQSDQIATYSDVYQLCSIFWFVVTKRHPTGILQFEDWGSNDKRIYSVITRALSHNPSYRPQNGKELYDELYSATISKGALIDA